MDLGDIRQFADFSRLDRDDLSTILRHSRRICFPAPRTLLRGGRKLSGRLYLLEGSVRTSSPDELIQAGTARARQPIYPGACRIDAVSPCSLLHVDWERVSFLAEVMATDTQAEAAWQERFLTSPMLRRTSPETWRRILTQMDCHVFTRGDRVVREGTAADGCYVLREGHAVVHSARHTLAYLMPGDFFGEDALVTGRVRNASITMLDDGKVLRMPETLFRQMLLQPLVPHVSVAGKGVLVNAGTHPIEGSVPVSLRWLRQQVRQLDRSRPHYVVGGRSEDRSLAALILIQAGINAAAVLD